jgi:hypothetical protein
MVFTLLIRIRAVPISNFVWAKDYPDGSFRSFPQSFDAVIAIVPHIKLWPLPCTPPRSYYLIIILGHDVLIMWRC